MPTQLQHGDSGPGNPTAMTKASTVVASTVINGKVLCICAYRERYIIGIKIVYVYRERERERDFGEREL